MWLDWGGSGETDFISVTYRIWHSSHAGFLKAKSKVISESCQSVNHIVLKI